MTDLAGAAATWTVGDRQIAFTVLLPEARGPVLLAVRPEVELALLARYPGAVPVEARGVDIVARGDQRPVAAGSADLVVAEEGRLPQPVLAGLAGPSGALALIGGAGKLRIHPDLERPEQVWRPGWPVSMNSGPARWARRGLALRTSRAGTRPRLSVRGGRASLADAVVADIAKATGGTFALVGVVTAGHTVLRLRGDDGDVAVRLTLSRGERLRDPVEQMVGEVPGLVDLLPEVLARGETHGHPWVAARWVAPGSRFRSLTTWLRASTRRSSVAEGLVDCLADAPTGRTGAGWAEQWCGSVVLLPEDHRRRAVTALRRLEADLPTSWCHGDLWSGNILLDGARAVVIDWDNALRDAPSGLDRVLLPVLGPVAPRTPSGSGDPVCGRIMALAELDSGPGTPVGPVAGREWAEWPREDRRALALAACVLYLRNRSLLDLGEEQLGRELEALEPGLPSVEVHPDALPGGSAPAVDDARRTARGALWLGTSSLVVKTSQTVVLLTLAALLAPTALGLIALGTLVANIAAILANLGTANALVYWRGDVQRAARTAVTVGLASGGLLAAALWVLAPSLAATFRADDGAAVIRGLTVVLPCVAVASVTGELLRRRLAFRRRVIPDLVASVAGAVVAIALAFSGVGVMSLVAGQVVQGVLTMLVAWLVHPPVLPGWNTEDARALLSYGGPMSGAQLLELIQLNLDYLFVSRVLGALALGLYSLAFRLAYLPHLMIVIVITGAAFPYLCQRRGAELARAAERVAVATVTLVAPVCLGLALFAEHLVILGEGWEPAVPVAAWLAGYALFLAVGQLVQVTLNASGRPALSFQLRLAHLLGLLVALPIAVQFDIVAVAVTQVVVAALVATLACVLASRNLPGLSLRRVAAGLRAAGVAAAAMTVAVLALRRVLPPDPSSVVDLVVGGVTGLAVYLLVVRLLDAAGIRELAVLLRRRS